MNRDPDFKLRCNENSNVTSEHLVTSKLPYIVIFE